MGDFLRTIGRGAQNVVGSNWFQAGLEGVSPIVHELKVEQRRRQDEEERQRRQIEAQRLLQELIGRQRTSQIAQEGGESRATQAARYQLEAPERERSRLADAARLAAELTGPGEGSILSGLGVDQGQIGNLLNIERKVPVQPRQPFNIEEEKLKAGIHAAAAHAFDPGRNPLSPQSIAAGLGDVRKNAQGGIFGGIDRGALEEGRAGLGKTLLDQIRFGGLTVGTAALSQITQLVGPEAVVAAVVEGMQHGLKLDPGAQAFVASLGR